MGLYFIMVEIIKCIKGSLYDMMLKSKEVLSEEKF